VKVQVSVHNCYYLQERYQATENFVLYTMIIKKLMHNTKSHVLYMLMFNHWKQNHFVLEKLPSKIKPHPILVEICMFYINAKC